MKLLLVIGIILLPFVMMILQMLFPKLRSIFNMLAIISIIVFGSISSTAIYTIIRDKTVFMTNIHGLFLNPFFNLVGSYLGLYLIYRLMLITKEEIADRN